MPLIGERPSTSWAQAIAASSRSSAEEPGFSIVEYSSAERGVLRPMKLLARRNMPERSCTWWPNLYSMSVVSWKFPRNARSKPKEPA